MASPQKNYSLSGVLLYPLCTDILEPVTCHYKHNHDRCRYYYNHVRIGELELHRDQVPNSFPFELYWDDKRYLFVNQ
jgi:hypothetical protein